MARSVSALSVDFSSAPWGSANAQVSFDTYPENSYAIMPVMKDYHFLAAILIVALSPLLTTGCQPSSGSIPPWRGIVKIGLVLPFHGHDAATAENVLMAVKLAVNEWNDRGGMEGRRVELVAMDDESDPEVAAFRAKEMIADPVILGVIGHLHSDTLLAVVGEYQSASLALLTLSSSESSSTLNRSAVFQLCASDEDISATAQEAMQSLGVTRLAIVRVSTPGYEARAEAFVRAATSAAVEITTTASILPQATDFAGLIQALKVSQVDMVIYSGHYKQAALLASAMGQSMPSVAFLAGGEADTPDFVRLVTKAPVRVMYLSTLTGSDNTNQREFEAHYSQATGRMPHTYSSVAYDAVNLLLRSGQRILQQGSYLARPLLIDGLHHGSDYEGISGRIAFDTQGGRVNAGATIRQVVDQRYPGEIIRKQSAAEVAMNVVAQ